MLFPVRTAAVFALFAVSLVACDEKKDVTSDADDDDSGVPATEDPAPEPTDGGEDTTDGGEDTTDGGEDTTDGEATSEATTAVEEPYDPHMEDWPAMAVPCGPEVDPQKRACEVDGKAGQETCILIDGEPFWTPCQAGYTCTPGENEDYGCLGSYCAWDGAKLSGFSWQTDPDCATPLVLRFDAAPLTFSASAAGTGFDFRGEPAGAACTTDWPDAPWLALDRDRSGSIDSGRELFGSGTRLAAGGLAAHGFEALAELDSDGDGSITAMDAMFSALVLWSDGDGDRVGALPELLPVADVGLVAIHLAYTRGAVCDARGNCGGEAASFEFRAADGSLATGEVVDVYLACQ